MSRKERILIFLLAALQFTHILDFMIMMPLGNYLMPGFGISPRQFSFLVAAYPLTAFFSGFTAAFFVDRYDRKKILLAAYIGFIAGTIACGFAPNYFLLMAARTLTGLFGGLIGAQIMSIVADLFQYERRGRAMGAVMSSFAVASTLGVPFALYLANLFNWQAPFLLVGALGLLLIPFLFRHIPNVTGHVRKRTGEEYRFQAFLQVAHNRNQRLALLFSGLIMLGHFLIIPFINPYLEFNQGFSRNLTPMVYLFGGMASFLAALALGRLSDKLGKLRVFTWSVLFSLVMVYIITNLPAVAFSIVLIFFAAWFIVATGRAVTAQAMISNVVPAEQRGSFLSFNSSVQQLGTGLASLLAGFIVFSDKTGRLHRVEWVGYFSILVLVSGLLLARYLFTSMDAGKSMKA